MVKNWSMAAKSARGIWGCGVYYFVLLNVCVYV